MREPENQMNGRVMPNTRRRNDYSGLLEQTRRSNKTGRRYAPDLTNKTCDFSYQKSRFVYDLKEPHNKPCRPSPQTSSAGRHEHVS